MLAVTLVAAQSDRASSGDAGSASGGISGGMPKRMQDLLRVMSQQLSGTMDRIPRNVSLLMQNLKENFPSFMSSQQTGESASGSN